MNKLRLFAFILLGIVIFTSCRKSKDTPANASIVRVMVSNNKGEVLKNTLVWMYDPASFEVFKKDPTTAALLGVATNDKGIATFELTFWIGSRAICRVLLRFVYLSKRGNVET